MSSSHRGLDYGGRGSGFGAGGRFGFDAGGSCSYDEGFGLGSVGVGCLGSRVELKVG